MRSKMLQNKIRCNILNKSKGEMKGSLYVIGCAVNPIFEGEEKIITTNMKFPLKGSGQFGHKIFVSNNFSRNIYHKIYWKELTFPW